MDPILPILSLLGYWAIILGSFGGPGTASGYIYTYIYTPFNMDSQNATTVSTASDFGRLPGQQRLGEEAREAVQGLGQGLRLDLEPQGFFLGSL